MRLRLRAFCASAERLAGAKANGCPWGEARHWSGVRVEWSILAHSPLQADTWR